jgi:hypothetical protein
MTETLTGYSPEDELAALEAEPAVDGINITRMSATGEQYSGEAGENVKQPAVDVVKAIELANRRVPRKPAPGPRKTATERVKEEIDERTRQALHAQFDAGINALLTQFDARRRLTEGAETKFGITNANLLKLLHEKGYISQEMRDAGQLDLAAMAAAQILTDKNIPANVKRHLLGPSSNLVRDVLSEEVTKYFWKRISENQ